MEIAVRCLSLRTVPLLAICAFLATLTIFTVRASEAQSELELRVAYEVFYKGMSAGRSYRTIVQNGDEYRVENKIEPNSLAAFFGSQSYKQISVFEFKQKEIIPKRFSIESAKVSESMSGEFDRNSGILALAGGDILSLPTVPSYDIESWYASLILTPLNELQGDYISIIEDKNFRNYVYTDLQPEQIDTSLGTVQSLRITMKNVNDSGRWFTIWVAPEFNNIPIRIVKFKNKKPNLTFEILDFAV